MNLYQHQINFLSANPAKTALVWSCGTGKSRAALEWTKRHRGSVLIVCPKPLKANWLRECQKWDVSALVMTKEEFKKSIDTLLPFGQLIVDEIHNGFLTPHFKSDMSKALRWYLKKHSVSRILLLSATVYSSSPWNIYNLAFYCGKKINYRWFDSFFFDYVRMGLRMIPVAKKTKSAKAMLVQLTRMIASVVDINDCMDVPEQLHMDPEYFSLGDAQIRAIRRTYDPVPIVRYTLQHEIENGILIGNEFREDESFYSNKIERIISLVEENPKIAIICRYNAQIDLLAERLKDFKPLIIRGSTKDRDAVTVAAENSRNCIVLIQADCAEGYQLPSFPLCVFASMSYSYVKWEQICGRFLRMDKPSKTAFMYLLSEDDSIDQGVYDAVKRKEDFKIELYKK